MADDALAASGGGASIYFTKPTWQTGTGVPSDGRRDVPDLALNASPNHDGYLFCSEDGTGGTVVSTCTSGFRTGERRGILRSSAARRALRPPSPQSPPYSTNTWLVMDFRLRPAWATLIPTFTTSPRTPRAR